MYTQKFLNKLKPNLPFEGIEPLLIESWATFTYVSAITSHTEPVSGWNFLGEVFQIVVGLTTGNLSAVVKDVLDLTEGFYEEMGRK
jgi:hypothetical protein